MKIYELRLLRKYSRPRERRAPAGAGAGLGGGLRLQHGTAGQWATYNIEQKNSWTLTQVCDRLLPKLMDVGMEVQKHG